VLLKLVHLTNGTLSNMHSISLQSSDSSIAVNDILGRIGFAASNETGSDAIKVSALILAVAEGTFDSTNNPTSLTFSTGQSETATEKMRLTSDGKLGINTSSPSSKLEIAGDGSTTDDGIITVNDPSSGGTTSWIKLYADDGYDDLTWHIAYGDTSMFKDLEFRTSFSSVPEVTIFPSGTLNVDSTGTSTKRFTAYDFYSTTYNTAALPAYTFANDLDTGMWLASANNLCFSTGGTERLRISSAGDVTIGGDAQIDDVIVGEWDGGATYAGLTHKDYLSSAYMMISNGASNFISCGAGGITYIRGASNLTTNGEIRLSSGQVIVNENGDNVDFRVEGDTDVNLIRADASADNVGIGYYLPSEKLQVHGTIKVSNGGGLGREDDGVHMAFPGGAMDKNSGSTQTGYLKISLPTSWSNTMIMFDLDVYEYNANGLAALRKFKIGGYNHTGSGGRWVRQVALYDGTGAINHKFKVHFGHDGTNCAIYISKVSATGTDSGAASSWSYSQANVSNFFGGYSSDTMAKWADGWDITWTTTLGVITLTSVVAPSHKQEDIVGIGTTSQSITPNTVGAGHGLHIASDSFPELHLTNDTTGHASSAGANIQLNTNKLVLLNRDTTGLIQAYTAATKLNLSMSSSESCFNEAGDDIDFRVEGDTDASLFFIDASTDRVGIKTQLPQSDFEVLGTSHLRGNVILGDASIPIVSSPIKATEEVYFKENIIAAKGITLNNSVPSTTTNVLYNDAGTLMWDGSEVGSGGGSSNLIRGSFAITTSTSVFTVSGGYATNSLDVYQNGIKLFKGASYDFTETGGGTTFTLANAATNGDLIEYIALNASTSATGNTSLGSISVTSNQTVFNTSDTFTSSNLAVFLNGVKLVDGTDYNVTSSSQFTLTSTAISGDIVEYIAYGATVASSNLSKTGDTMTGNLTVNADLIVTGYKETHTDNGNTGTAQTIDISDSTLQTYTLTGNCTFTMPTADAGRSFTMFLKTGAGSFTSTFTGVKFPRNVAPTITTDANRMDILTFYSDGTNWYGSTQQEYHV